MGDPPITQGKKVICIPRREKKEKGKREEEKGKRPGVCRRKIAVAVGIGQKKKRGKQEIGGGEEKRGEAYLFDQISPERERALHYCWSSIFSREKGKRKKLPRSGCRGKKKEMTQLMPGEGKKQYLRHLTRGGKGEEEALGEKSSTRKGKRADQENAP